MEIKIKKLKENAIIPSRGSMSAAGYDLYACLEQDEIKIEPNTNQMIGTGIALEIPDGYFGGIFARSGMAVKQSLRPATCTSVMDSDYRGEYIVVLHNDSKETKIIKNGERIAQLVIMPYLEVKFNEVQELSKTNRGSNRFGSSGTN